MRLRWDWLDVTGSGISVPFLYLSIFLSLFAQEAHAQSIQSRVVSDDGINAVVEFTYDWSTTLKTAVDSSGINRWDQNVLSRFAGGFDETSVVLETGSAGMPQISVLTREYDEVRVSLLPTSRLNKRDVPEIELISPGMHRRKQVVTLSARLFDLDEITGVLRRYRKLQVAVTRRSPVTNRLASAAITNNPHVQITRSVLADGTLYKILVVDEGIYRIDRTLLTDLGLSPDAIEPNQVQIFGNGGAPVPAINGTIRFADLVQNAVVTNGGGDSSFDVGDEVLFYAKGPTGWVFAGGKWRHYVHPFSNENAYFLKIGSAESTQRASIGHVDEPSAVPVSSSTGRHVSDFEEFVWSREHGSGQDWMSRTIRQGTSRPIFEDLSLTGLLGGSVTYWARAAIASNPRATVAFESSDAVLAQMTASRIVIDGAEFPSASAGEIEFSQSVGAGQNVNLSMRLLNQGIESEAAVDWVRVFYSQNLIAQDGYLRFATDPGLSGEQRYELSGFSTAPRLWNVTAPQGDAGPELVSGNTYAFRYFSEPDDFPSEFVAFTESAIRSVSVENVAAIPNQDLHGEASYPDLVIVTPTEFISAANRLADHRRQEGLDVVVSTVDKIYNEFSGGVADMRAIRDYFKFLYDRAPDEASLLRFALLIGDGHYDFRGLSGLESQDRNWLFPYETEESLNPDASFTSDDYFGLLDDDEGAWIYTTFSATSDERVDIGIGRLPVQSSSEADMVVDKIIGYEDPQSFGSWRSRYIAVADDGPTGLSGTQNDADLHLQNIDQVVELIRGGLYSKIDVDKIYAESFERVFQNGFRIPGAKQEINTALNSGALVFNYSGHGGPDGLAQEEIFTKDDAEQLQNGGKLPLFITATCSFGWWDLEDGRSGAEALLLNDEGGAVALFTTVRLVYTSRDTTALNAGLNRALNQELFKKEADGSIRRLGDVLRLTKNTGVGLQGNSRKLMLLGDPSMRLGIPEEEVSVEQLNSVPLQTTPGQLKALDLVEINGQINLPSGTANTSFNGTADVTVFDAVRQVPLKTHIHMPTPYYNIREDLIWRGEVAVESGQFTARFVVPKDISYSNNAGRISVYAASQSGDALGFSENFLVGGTSDNPPNDAIGPELDLFLNDTTFVSGAEVLDDPELIVRIYDQSGVNTVGAGVGHEMLLVVDGEEGGAQDISSGFVAERNSYQRGETRWRLGELDPGPHYLSVRAWDVVNNSSSEELTFVIADDEVLALNNVYNYPNPMNRETRFVFDHNQPTGTSARVQIRIYTLNGRPIRTIDTEEALPEGILTGRSVQIPWNGLDDDYDRPATGIYLYKLRVEVDRADGAIEVSERIEKLAIIR